MQAAPMISEMYCYILKIHEKCTDPSTGRYAALMYWSLKFKVVVNVYLLMLALTFVTILLYPLVLYMMTGEMETMLPIMLPFVDESTYKGYFTCMCIQCGWVLLAGFGMMASDLTYSMMALYCLPLIDVYCDLVEGMNVALRANRKFGETAEMRKYFGNMLLLHKDIVA